MVRIFACGIKASFLFSCLVAVAVGLPSPCGGGDCIASIYGCKTQPCPSRHAWPVTVSVFPSIMMVWVNSRHGPTGRFKRLHRRHLVHVSGIRIRPRRRRARGVTLKSRLRGLALRQPIRPIQAFAEFRPKTNFSIHCDLRPFGRQRRPVFLAHTRPPAPNKTTVAISHNPKQPTHQCCYQCANSFLPHFCIL